jgi:uncharacterized protein (TIGR00730 family)
VADAGDGRVEEWLDELGVERDRELVGRLLDAAVRLGTAGLDRLDLKIAARTLDEQLAAATTFAPYAGIRKIAIFGSARTAPEEPAYRAARELGAAIASRGWMVVTGGGPGIMTAGVEGAGVDRSFGVTIELPFEPVDSNPLAGDPKSVGFRYFFNRKLAFMRAADAYVLLPGGFGTMDEAFELLTLLQTGRETPGPVVLLEPTGDAYWRSFRHFLDVELLDAGLIDRADLDLFHLTSDVEDACDYVTDFYRVFHSVRYVRDHLVVRLATEVDDDCVDRLNEEFSDLLVGGRIERCGPSDAERRDRDHVDLPRLRLRFVRARHGRLHALIRSLNRG